MDNHGVVYGNSNSLALVGFVRHSKMIEKKSQAVLVKENRHKQVQADLKFVRDNEVDYICPTYGMWGSNQSHRLMEIAQSSKTK